MGGEAIELQRVAFFSRSLAKEEAAVVIRGQGKSPIVFGGPGSVRTFGRWKQMIFVDLRPLTVEFTALDVPTKDGARLRVHGSMDAQVVRAVEAATKVVDYRQATSQIAETAVRASLRGRPSSDLVDRLADIEQELLGVIRSAVVAWGVSVSAVRVRSFDGSDKAILELVAEDGTPFLTLSDVVGATDAQSSVRGLWRRGLVEVVRVHEMGAPPDRPVSTLMPDVPSTSRLVEEVLSGDDAEAAIDDSRNWRRLGAMPVGVWYEVTPTTETEAAYHAAWLEDNPVDRA